MAPAAIEGLHPPHGTMDQVAGTIFVRQCLPGTNFLQKWPKIDPKGSKCPKLVEAKIGSTHKHRPLTPLTPALMPRDAAFVRQSSLRQRCGKVKRAESSKSTPLSKIDAR